MNNTPHQLVSICSDCDKAFDNGYYCPYCGQPLNVLQIELIDMGKAVDTSPITKIIKAFYPK